MEIQIDVLVIGGGAAGSAAALQLGRTRRSVVMIDSGQPRNAPAAHMHGYLGHDGRPPGDFVQIAHDEVAAYGVTITAGRVASVIDAGDRLRCITESGDTYIARRVVLASGITDVLPDLDGVRELWGERVIHCPWCHGWEVRDRSIGVIDTSGAGVHQAILFAQLSNRVTLVRNDLPEVTDDEAERLRHCGVEVEARPARAIAERGNGLEIVLDGDVLAVDVAVVGPRFEPNATMVEGLVELSDHVSGMGRHVVVDSMGRTSHPKISAIGNVAEPMQQVLNAASNGSTVAMALHGGPGGLIDEDIERARRSEAGRLEWDDRYGGHDNQMWSGQPNGSLVVEVEHLTPGRALDIGCGEGADAVWLARRGWNVSATDISTVAIDRARSATASLDLEVSFDAVDVTVDAPLAQSFDLLTMAYPAFERASGRASLPSIADAVAPGGRLFVVVHADDAADSERAKEHGFDPAAYLSVDDIIELLGEGFSIEVDVERDRPDAPSGSHHQRDRVLVIRRASSCRR